MESFRIKDIHFIILIIVFTMILYIIGNIHLSVSRSSTTKDILIELNETNLSDSINQNDICFVFFYTPDSKSSNNMLNKLSKLSTNPAYKMKIYKIDTNKYSQVSYKHNISGTPSVLIFKNGKEDNRILGIIPLSNLEMIYKRYLK